MNQIKEQKQGISTKQDNLEVLLFVSTSKGGFIYYSNPERLIWEIFCGPFFLASFALLSPSLAR